MRAQGGLHNSPLFSQPCEVVLAEKVWLTPSPLSMLPWPSGDSNLCLPEPSLAGMCLRTGALRKDFLLILLLHFPLGQVSHGFTNGVNCISADIIQGAEISPSPSRWHYHKDNLLHYKFFQWLQHTHLFAQLHRIYPIWGCDSLFSLLFGKVLVIGFQVTNGIKGRWFFPLWPTCLQTGSFTMNSSPSLPRILG